MNNRIIVLSIAVLCLSLMIVVSSCGDDGADPVPSEESSSSTAMSSSTSISASSSSTSTSSGSTTSSSTSSSTSSASSSTSSGGSALMVEWDFDGSNLNTSATSPITDVLSDNGNINIAYSAGVGGTGMALQLQYSNRAQKTDDTNYFIGTNPGWTVECWIYLDELPENAGTTYDKYIIQRHSSVPGGWFLYFDKAAHELRFRVEDVNDTRNTVGDNGGYKAYAVGQWLHIVGVYDGAMTVSLYTNGGLAEQNALAFSGDKGDAVRSLNLGSNNSDGGARTFMGRMDNVRIYNAALTPAEILNNYLNP